LKKSSGSCSICLRRRRTNSDMTLGFDLAKSPQEQRRATKFFQCSKPCKDCPHAYCNVNETELLCKSKCKLSCKARKPHVSEAHFGSEKENHRDREEKNKGELQLPEHFHPISFKVPLGHFLCPLTSVHVVLAETLLNDSRIKVSKKSQEECQHRQGGVSNKEEKGASVQGQIRKLSDFPWVDRWCREENIYTCKIDNSRRDPY
jgi:hypothetical protein